MKKIILSVLVVASSFWAQSQVVVAGVSPASVQGNYDFGVQADAGWPSYTVGSTTGEFWGMNLDFGIPGTFIMDTLMLAETGEPGTNPEGNPISQEACDTLINDLTGKIAVVYRNTCDFSDKVKMCEDAGAIAVIVINREDDVNFIMTATDTGEGPNTTIPAVLVSNITGALLTSEMQNEPVVMLIGNKITAFDNDVGASRDEILISPFAGANSMIDSKFDIGIQLYNYGNNPQNNVTVTATIDGPTGQVYNEMITAPAMVNGDTLSIFNGNTYEFPPFDLGGIGNYPAGDYTLTYDIDLGIADDSDFDNTFTSVFTVNPDVISLAGIDGSNIPGGTGYPSNTEGEYQSCMFFEDLRTRATLGLLVYTSLLTLILLNFWLVKRSSLMYMSGTIHGQT